MACPNPPPLDRAARAAPPHLWFAVSAVFHYLGPAFAVLLFPALGVLGVAWLRVASAAAIFGPITRPDRIWARADRSARRRLLALGATLAAMNAAFYLALERLPMSLVAAMEFLAVLGLALHGARTGRNLAALALAAAGTAALLRPEWAADPVGLAWSAANALLFAAYVALGHRAARDGADEGVGRLGAAMLVAALALAPFGALEAAAAVASPALLAAGVGVGLCSSVIPYVCDQIAMSRLPRATFALMLAALPAMAAAIGALVLAQWPSGRDLAGIGLVMAGIALHQPPREPAL
ncbi:MAG: EamA family transporter [Pseudomonadota bacterium]